MYGLGEAAVLRSIMAILIILVFAYALYCVETQHRYDMEKLDVERIKAENELLRKELERTKQ